MSYYSPQKLPSLYNFKTGSNFRDFSVVKFAYCLTVTAYINMDGWIYLFFITQTSKECTIFKSVLPKWSKMHAVNFLIPYTNNCEGILTETGQWTTYILKLIIKELKNSVTHDIRWNIMHTESICMLLHWRLSSLSMEKFIRLIIF